MEAFFVVLIVVGVIWIFATVGKKDRDTSAPSRQALSRTSVRHSPSKARPPVYRPNPTYYAKRAKQLEDDKKPPSPSFPKDMVLQGKAYVIDGDTIAIRGTKVRLAGIDAPELDMPWGQKSKWAMVAICKGQTITAELDSERSFDRLVGTCYLPDGRDIGAELVKQGLALDLPCFSRGKYRPFEPAGARRRLANGKFGHRSLKGAEQSFAKM